jgi:ABC-type transport system substrate-binding protein
MRFALAIMGILKVPDGSDPDWDEHPIGVGPYEVVWDPDVGDVQLTRADNWWREPGRADGVDIQPLSDYQIHYIMYENGEIDIGTRFPGDVRTSAHKFYDELYVSKGGSIFFGGYDVTAPPFDDINVRKALNHAVDWRTIQEAIWPTYHYPTQIIAPSLPCFDPTREGYVYDPELARKYLADSKYGSASNLPAIVAPVSGAQWISAYEVMQEQLQDNLGVYLSLIRVESGQPPPEGTNMIRSSQGATLPDAGHMVNGLGYSHDPLVRDKAKFINPLIDAYLDAANAAPLDDPRRCENFRAADREIMANYYYFPVFGGTFGPDVLVQPWVANFDMMYYGDFISIPWMQVKTRTR